jgi:hypothetical protein
MKSSAAKRGGNRCAVAKMSEIMSRLPSLVTIDAPFIQRPRIVLAYGFKVQIKMQVMLDSGSINSRHSRTLANQIRGSGRRACLAERWSSLEIIEFRPRRRRAWSSTSSSRCS